MRRPSGFTILEIIVVLLLMGIVSAYVLGRSLTATDLDLVAATDKLRLQLRYAQSEAMKLAHKDAPVWGVKAAGGKYWLFRGTNPDSDAEKVRIPGADYRTPASKEVETADLGVTLNTFTVFFDRIGKPYSAYNDKDATTPVTGAPLPVSVSAGADSRTINITPETGLVQ